MFCAAVNGSASAAGIAAAGGVGLKQQRQTLSKKAWSSGTQQNTKASSSSMCRNSPCKKNYFITELRKVGDYVHQYVTNVYYLDTLTTHTLNDDVEIYSSAMSGTILVYSSKHPECDECLQHRKQVKENKIVGWKIYPIGMKPEKNYKEKKNN